jgi:transcriptional regulator with XRE-family HTH domain
MKLREARARKLFSAKELASLSGVSESNIYSIEHGGWLPSLGTVKKLSSVLGVDPMEISEFKASIEKSSGKGE